jgi:hypothetical protein
MYVHDSRAGFLRVDSSGYLRPREIIEPSSPPKLPSAQKSTAQIPSMAAKQGVDAYVSI